MDPITDKYSAFEHFLNNMAESEEELRDNMQEAGNLIKNRIISINSDKETLAFARNKLDGLTDPKEITKLKGHISDLELRIEASQAVLLNTKKMLSQYEADLTGSQLEILAKDAVDEQYQEIIKWQNLFHEVIINVEAARNTYLKSIIRVGEIRNIGRGAVERLKRAVPHAKVVGPSYAEFETNLYSLKIELPEIKTAFHRCTLK
jgi:hypothetical protein